MSFFSGCLLHFPMSLFFRTLITACLSIYFFGFTVSLGLLWSLSFLNLYTFMLCFSFFKFRKYSAVISSDSISVLLSFSSPSRTPITQMLDVVIHKSLRLCSIFFSLFTLCCSDWLISIVLFSG